MTAGSGILHIETPPGALVVAGGLFHGIQLWVNLPAKDKMIPPAYQGLEAGTVTLLASADAGSLVRVIAGEIGGHAGSGATHTPMALAHATISPARNCGCPGTPGSTSWCTSWPDPACPAPKGTRCKVASRSASG
jgi:redox-sensitive bicupin YhaK (pirin superfamily)